MGVNCSSTDKGVSERSKHTNPDCLPPPPPPAAPGRGDAQIGGIIRSSPLAWMPFTPATCAQTNGSSNDAVTM